MESETTEGARNDTLRRCLSVDNDELLLNKLQGLVTNIKWTPEEAVDLFVALLDRFQFTAKAGSHLTSWMLEMLHCIEINFITPTWTSKGTTAQEGMTLIHLVRNNKVTNEGLKKSLADDTEKKLEEIIEEMRQQTRNQSDEELLGQVKDIVSSVISGDRESMNSGLNKDLLMLCEAAEKTHYKPRLTQMVSWCVMALSQTGRLIQVGTGEGKSCIVAMFAALRAMRGEKVDIMSSSPVLAERDSKEWREFYNFLDISVDCNISKNDSDLRRCYGCQVVYGTVEELAGDWLKHHFYRKDIFGKRRFQCAIVDEVDSLMLDKGLHVVYLTNDMPAMQPLNSLLAFIWDTANQYSNISTAKFVSQEYPFYQVVLKYITTDKTVDMCTVLQMAEDAGLLAKGSASEFGIYPSGLHERLSGVTVDQLAMFFKEVERIFPSCRFALHYMNSDRKIEEVDKELQGECGEKQRVPLLLVHGGLCQYMYTSEESVVTAAEEDIKAALHFTPCKLDKGTSCCYIPGFLSDLVKSKLRVWIQNAFYAKTLTDGHEYITEKHGIIPVDYSCTGVVENFMKWSNGLQQFLELKHKSKLSDITVITNYMSSVGLLQKYKDHIYGISGTLGQQAEIETLKKIYVGISTCVIPTFKRRKLFEVEGVFVDDEKEWIEKILDVVVAEISPTAYRQGRAVLIICETINRAQVLHDNLADEVQSKKLYINNNMDNTAIFAKELDVGEVIVATNLAGRGTDLKVSEHVKEAGGLFVVQTFLPKNSRVEMQAFGRTARQGAPGSAQLIVCSSHLSASLKLMVRLKKLQNVLENRTNLSQPNLDKELFEMEMRLYQRSHSNKCHKYLSHRLSVILKKRSDSGIKTAKAVREAFVSQKLEKYLEHDIPGIKKKEELFLQYLASLDHMYKCSNNKPAASQVSAMNEFWGIWLLTNYTKDASVAYLKNKLEKDLVTAKRKLQCRESPLSNPHHYIAFGNELRNERQLEESVEMYTKAIEQDHCWAAIAYYNRAFASLILQDMCQDPNCISRAWEDLKNALESVELHCEQTAALLSYSTKPTSKPHSDSLANRLHTHILARNTVLKLFRENISNAMQSMKMVKQLGATFKVKEGVIYSLVPTAQFLPLKVLMTKALDSLCPRDTLRMHQAMNQPLFDMLDELISLESLGLTHVCSLQALIYGGQYMEGASEEW